MIILYLKPFIRQYKKLPSNIQDLARQKELIFKSNPFDPRLKTHRLGGKLESYWSFRINYSYRIIFEFSDNEIVHFHEIGNHDIYE